MSLCASCLFPFSSSINRVCFDLLFKKIFGRVLFFFFNSEEGNVTRMYLPDIYLTQLRGYTHYNEARECRHLDNLAKILAKSSVLLLIYSVIVVCSA